MSEVSDISIYRAEIKEKAPTCESRAACRASPLIRKRKQQTVDHQILQGERTTQPESDWCVERFDRQSAFCCPGAVTIGHKNHVKPQCEGPATRGIHADFRLRSHDDQPLHPCRCELRHQRSFVKRVRCALIDDCLARMWRNRRMDLPVWRTAFEDMSRPACRTRYNWRAGLPSL
jgi:hypothetical protein